MRILLLVIFLTALVQADPLATRTLPDSGLTVDVYLTSVNDQKASRAWCYRTSGLGPGELSLTLLIAPEEKDNDFPEEPLRVLDNLAKQPDKLTPGLLSSSQPIFRPEMTGLLLVPEDALEGIPGSQGGYAVVTLFANEVRVAQMAGASRVMGALAEQVRYYPCPIWCDRSRDVTFSEDDIAQMSNGPLSSLPILHTDASAMISDDTLSVRMTEDTARLVAEELQEKGLARLSLEMDPRANAFLIWTRDPNRLAAVNPHESDGSKLSGQYILIVPDEEQVCRILSDGYAVGLTEKALGQLLSALETGGSFEAPLAEGEASKFTLEWVKSEYYNPVENVTYKSRDGWVTYKEGDGTPEGSVFLKEIVLLTPEPVLERSVDTDELIGMVQTLEKLGKEHLEALRGEKAIDVMLQCDLNAEEKYRIATNEAPEGIDAILDEFYNALLRLDLPSMEGPVKFLIVFTVRPR